MTLHERQVQFMRLVPSLINRAFELGYEVTGADLYRDPRCPYGHQKSLHRSRLAIDLCLHKNGKYLTRNDDYRELGEWWEKQGGTWGGRFNDGNHFSLDFDGMA